MSGRIRTIKPELLDDAVTAGLSDMAFRIFMAVIVLADDYGRLRAEPAWLMGQVYWNRTVQVESFQDALRELDLLINFYEVKGQKYAEIRNWSKHQKVSHPGKPRIPAPPESLPKPSGESPETLVPDLRSPITDQGSPTKDQEPPPAPEDPTKVPEWFGSAIGTVEDSTGEKLRPADSWLRYSGHRAGKGIPKGQQDAVYWLTTVMVPEARKERRAESDKRERDAKWDRQRAGPGSLVEPLVETAAEQKANAARLAERIAQRKAREKGAA